MSTIKLLRLLPLGDCCGIHSYILELLSLQRLTGQIELIAQELSQLTMLEVEQRELRVELQQDVLESRRHALTGFLSQLLSERHHREHELLMRLVRTLDHTVHKIMLSSHTQRNWNLKALYSSLKIIKIFNI